MTSIREPVLLSKLRTALSHLYSLHNNASHPNINPSHQHEAHNYLIDFQSRNIRRKIVSLHQKKKDSSTSSNPKTNESAASIVTTLAPDDEHNGNGSSIYACLPILLFSVPSHETERVFCAQTILHRLRRMKLSEALDFDCEFMTMTGGNGNGMMEINGLMNYHMNNSSSGQNQNQNAAYFTEYIKFHGEQLSALHVTLLGQVFQRYFQSFHENISSGNMASLSLSSMDLEERIKGELMLLILATTAYLNVYAHTLQSTVNTANGAASTSSNIGAILNTLSSSMAVVALRMRYTPASIAANRPAIDIPIVTQVMHAFQSVSQLASSQSHETLVPGAINININSDMQRYLLENNAAMHQKTLSQCLCVSLACVPDALVGSPGGARGRLSIDPKCIVATNTELRSEETGVGLLRGAIFQLIEGTQGVGVVREDGLYMQEQILVACERWARFVPLPLDFVEKTLSATLLHLGNATSNSSGSSSSTMNSFEKAFFAYLVRIYEGACMTVDQLVATAAGLSSDQNSACHQSGRRKQSSKSKKRQKERLQAIKDGRGKVHSNHSVQNEPKVSDAVHEATRESNVRGLVACHAAMLTWEKVNQIFTRELEIMAASLNAIVEGEGAIGCICTCVSACLPYFIRYGPLAGDGDGDGSQSQTLISLILEALKNICSNHNASVRALSYEHITIIHKVLVENSNSARARTISIGIEQIVVDRICECCIVLSQKCAYPPGYFDNLVESNDDDLEIERNDVRDLVRAVCNLEGSGDLPQVSLFLLESILRHCANEVSTSNEALPSETVVHVLSTPAKSLYRLSRILQDPNDPNKPAAERILHAAFDCLYVTCGKLIDVFSKSAPMGYTLAVSRLAALAISSYASMFSSMVHSMQVLPADMQHKLQRTIGFGVLAISASITHIPELVAASSLNISSRFDIRGAMRGPGGEDHCGCIAFIRLVREGEQLSLACMEYAAACKNSDVRSIFVELGKIYTYLHTAEVQRPPGQIHGEGVTPKSRRTFLTGVTSMGLIIMKRYPETESLISPELKGFFHQPMETIVTCNNRAELTDAQKLFLMCEACFDLAAFPSIFCKELFKGDSAESSRVPQILIEACISGYKHPPVDEPTDSIIQWGRLRASILSLLRSSADPGLSAFGVEATKALISAECEAISTTLQTKSESSAFFHELVICEDVVAAGAFVVVVKDIADGITAKLKESAIDTTQAHGAIANCLATLFGCKDSVYAVLGYGHSSSEISRDWEDPCASLAEAWFLAVDAVIQACGQIQSFENSALKSLVSETLALFVRILLSKRVEKEQGKEPIYLSLDGPQTLAMVGFIESAFQMGPGILIEVANLFHANNMLLQTRPGDVTDPSVVGGGVVAAAIYRASSGAVPPWAVEYLPDMFKSLYESCGNEFLFAVLNTAADLKLSDSCTFGCIQPGKKLAGYYFDHLKPKIRDDFTAKTREICNAAIDGAKWRKLKVVIKAACGGKKNASGFSLKPGFTNWECDRV